MTAEERRKEIDDMLGCLNRLDLVQKRSIVTSVEGKAVITRSIAGLREFLMREKESCREQR